MWHFVRSICHALLYLLCLLRLFWCISVIIYIFHSLLLDALFVLSIWFILICLNYCLNNSINFLSCIFVSLCNLFCTVPQSHNLNFNQRRAWWRRLAANLKNPQVDRTVFIVFIYQIVSRFPTFVLFSVLRFRATQHFQESIEMLQHGICKMICTCLGPLNSQLLVLFCTHIRSDILQNNN